MANKENSNKMKGLLKGLRYISQMFDDNKDNQEMQIGFPTDVKHVAHIGWDGPATASSPSWMNEFQAPPGGAAAGPLSGEMNTEDTSKKGSKGTKSAGHDQPEVPKSSRNRSRGHEGNGTDSPRRAKSDKPKQSRRPSRREMPERSGSQESMETGSESSLPDIPKKSRRKKSKEGGGSKKTREPRTQSSENCSKIELEGENKGFT